MRKAAGIVIDSFLLLTLLSLCYLFIFQSNSTTENSIHLPSIESKDRKQALRTKDYFLDERITWIKDQRSSKCQQKNYKVNKLKVTIVIDFYDYQLYALKVTLASILEHTEYIHEILVVDDGTTMAHIVAEFYKPIRNRTSAYSFLNLQAESYLSTLPRAKLLRSRTRRGQGHSRNLAASVSNADVLVFVDSNTVVSQGWLPPLMDYIISNKNSIAQPSYDLVRDTVSYEYVAPPSLLHNTHVTFDWQFSVRVADTPTRIESFFFKTPVLRGNVIAITKTNFVKLGSYDAMFESGGGENLELSIRASMKCSDIVVSRCSRVAVLNRDNPVVTRDVTNKKRIMALWMEKSMRDKIISFTNINGQIGDEERDSVKNRKLTISANNCEDKEKSFEEYLNGIPNELLYKLPIKKPSAFGYMKVRSGHCAFVDDTGRFALSPCPESTLPIQQDKLFTFTNNIIKFKEKCLQPLKSMYVEPRDCIKDDIQRWQFKDNKFLNRATRLCLMHVTDPNKSLEPTQILMAQSCDHYSNDDKRFLTFDFIKV